MRVVLQPRAVRKQHGLGSSHFDRHYSGNRSFFLLLQVLRCFSSLRSPHPHGWFRAFNPEGCPIRTCADQVLFADPRAFSQLTTSFIASGSLGIPRSLLLTYSSVIKVTIDSLSLSFLFVAYEIVVPTKKSMFVFSLKLINLLLFFFTSLSFSVFSKNFLLHLVGGCCVQLRHSVGHNHKVAHSLLPCFTCIHPTIF